MSFTKISILALATLGLSAGSALAASHAGPPVMTGQYRDQVFLVDKNMMSLYTFDNDTRGHSNCNGECAVKWPPLAGEDGMGLPSGYSLITRDDGSKQIAYKGQPLYLWFKDQHPRDMSGDGVKGVWHLARP